MPTALIYCRVSTREQAEGGISLEVQQADCEIWTADRGYTSEVFVDAGFSARTIDRPALSDLLAQLPDADALVVWKVDRLARDNVDRGLILRECKSHQVEFVAVTQPEVGGDSPEAQLVGNIVGAVAEFESRMTAARVRAAARRRAEAGGLPQRVAYGYRANDDSTWRIVDNEAETIRRIDRLYLEGLGTARIAMALNGERILSPTGGKWWTGIVRDILHRTIYSGVLTYGLRRNIPGGKTHRPADEPPVVTAVDVPLIRTSETQDRIRRHIELRSQKTGATGRPKHPFVSVLIHSRCGYGMVTKW